MTRQANCISPCHCETSSLPVRSARPGERNRRACRGESAPRTVRGINHDGQLHLEHACQRQRESSQRLADNRRRGRNATPGAHRQRLLRRIRGQHEHLHHPYTITVTDPEAASAVTLVDPDATLEDTTGYSTVETVGTLDLGGGTLTLDAGAFLLQGGTLANATVDIAGGSFLSSS